MGAKRGCSFGEFRRSKHSKFKEEFVLRSTRNSSFEDMQTTEAMMEPTLEPEITLGRRSSSNSVLITPK